MYEKNLDMMLALISIKDPRHRVTSSIYDSSPQYGDFSALWNSLYRQLLLSIYVAQWFTNTQVLSSNTAGTLIFMYSGKKKISTPPPNKIGS